MHSLWFFERLGIAATSDAKQIKRAYARALKAIDQQAERESFERLRAAYEQALAWAADRRTHIPHSDLAAGDTSIAQDLAHEQPPPAVTLGKTPPDSDEPRYPGEDRPRHAPEISWLTIHQWVARLMNPQGASYASLLDEALRDPQLHHLDAHEQLNSMLMDALYRAPLGQRELFAAAAARFGWAAHGALSQRHRPRQRWVSQVIDQSLLWASLEPATAAAYTAAIDAAAATDQPSPAQVLRHRAALSVLSHDFHAWCALSLPPGHIDAWRTAHDALPAHDVRKVKARQAAIKRLRGFWRAIKFTVGLFDNWLSRAMLAIMALSVVVHVVWGDDTRTPAERVSDNVMRLAYANAERAGPPAPRAAGQDVPMPLESLPGKVDRKACAATHVVLHQREPHVFDDPPLIASLGAHAMLCAAKNVWPQLTDPIVRCLEDESWAASNQYRPQANAHCVAAADAK